MDEQKLDRVLRSVEKPARYAGGEINAVVREGAPVRFALAFPDTYEVGSSHLGLKILYGALNSMEGVAAERVFAPALDMRKAMTDAGIPLFSLESRTPVREFELVGFSLQFELCLTTVLDMLSIAGVSARWSDRGEGDPIVVAGGPCTVNPEPFRDFFDVIVIGDGEDTAPEIASACLAAKTDGTGRAGALDAIRKIPGVFCPASPAPVKRRWVEDLNTSHWPDKPVVPFVEAVHDRAALEIMRGCPRGCRFCQAGFIYRPVRMKSFEVAKAQAAATLEGTGYDEISLASLSSTDWPHCARLMEFIRDSFGSRSVAASLPSLRMDSSSVALAAASKEGKALVTFAPEAGSQRMRDVINKNLSREQIFSAVTEAAQAGFARFKLYFMIGLPFEEDEDALAIARLSNALRRAALAASSKPSSLQFSISVACFVPKPHTPFQWFGMERIGTLERRQAIIIKALDRQVKLSYHDARPAALEAALARGGANLGPVIEEAHARGAVFDAWETSFDWNLWSGAFASRGLDIEEEAAKTFEPGSPLPWDYVDCGVSPEFFASQAQLARQEKTTQDCREGCADCGISGGKGRCGFEIPD